MAFPLRHATDERAAPHGRDADILANPKHHRVARPTDASPHIAELIGPQFSLRARPLPTAARGACHGQGIIEIIRAAPCTSRAPLPSASYSQPNVNASPSWSTGPRRGLRSTSRLRLESMARDSLGSSVSIIPASRLSRRCRPMPTMPPHRGALGPRRVGERRFPPRRHAERGPPISPRAPRVEPQHPDDARGCPSRSPPSNRRPTPPG